MSYFLWLLLRSWFFVFVFFFCLYEQLHYVSRCVFLCIYPPWVPLFPWICGLLVVVVSFYQIWKTFGQYYFQFFFCSICSLFSSETMLILLSDFLVLISGHSRLCSSFFFFQIFFFLYFNLDNLFCKPVSSNSWKIWMLTFSQKHRYPANDNGFLWGKKFGDIVVKKLEITRYYNGI